MAFDTRTFGHGLRAMFFLSSAVAAIPASAASPDSGGETLEQIVVTAQKKEENLQSVPVAVTAFTSDTIRELRIEDTRDLNGLAPGLSVQATPGGSLGASYSLRGVNAIGSFAGQGSGVAVYLDGVYQGSNTGLFFDVADVDRIEVLRGPQGTLFGRNATGGAISILTHQPTGNLDIHQELTYGNYDQIRIKTRLDLPAWGPLSTSFVYLNNEKRGDIRNIGAGTQFDFTNATDGRYGIRTAQPWLGSNFSDSFAGTAHLDLGSVQVSYKGDYTHKDFTDDGQGMVAFGYGGSAIPIGQLLYSIQPADLHTPFSNTRPDAVNNAFSTGGTLEVFGHNLTASWTPSDNITLKNILAYRHTRLIEGTGVDGYGFAGLALPDVAPGFNLAQALGGPPGSILGTLIGVTTDSRQHQWSDEAQFNFTSHWFDLTGGALYYQEYSASVPWINNATGTGVLSGLYFAQPLVPGKPISILNQIYVPSFLNSNSNSVFAQGKIHITDQIDVDLGGRETWDHKTGIDALSGVPFSVIYDESKPSWLAGANYRPTSNILTYAKWSTGFISGGQLSGQTYQTETATSYEIGMKADFWNGRARANVAVYHATYDSLQFPTTKNGLNLILNYGDARASGVEMEVAVIPFDGLSVTGNAGFLDFKLLSVDPAAAAGLQTTTSGVEPTNRPKWTSTVAVQYETPQPVLLNGRFLVRTDVDYKSGYFAGQRGYDDNGDGVVNSADATYGIIHEGSQILYNARAALAEIPVGRAKAEVAIWGKNLSNNRALQFETFVGFGYSGSYQRARTFGLDLTVDF